MLVMAGLGPAIHALFFSRCARFVDGRNKCGHDDFYFGAAKVVITRRSPCRS
jgi:hypothetical protein